MKLDEDEAPELLEDSVGDGYLPGGELPLEEPEDPLNVDKEDGEENVVKLLKLRGFQSSI